MLFRFFLLGLLLFAATAVEGRQWVDKTGNFRVEAELQAVDGDEAVLTKANGGTLRVPLDRLCDCDRQFATTLRSAVNLGLGSGLSLECTVLQKDAANLTVLHRFMVLRLPRSDVTATEELESSPAPTAGRSPRLADFRTVLVEAAVQPWASDLQQIPATVIDNGVLRNVPYKSFRAGQGYEINIYGDPAAPAGFEIGVRGGLLNDENARRNCLSLICSLLGEPADREALNGLPREKGKTVRSGLTLEITPASDPDAYGGWWVSVYDEQALKSVAPATRR